jgi:hypothetical protein
MFITKIRYIYNQNSDILTYLNYIYIKKYVKQYTKHYIYLLHNLYLTLQLVGKCGE